jgi:CheY-like chemotaxis protein
MAHVLLIDDDEQFRAMLAQMLALDLHEVTQASDGDEGLQRVSETPPDLIITDILMPNRDGIETVAALTEADSKIPIIAISGGQRLQKADFNLALASLIGVKATLTKPFTRADLRLAIKHALT